MRFQMLSDNSSFWKGGDIVLSTAEMPEPYATNRYESCLFTGRTSEVLGSYNDLKEAIVDHVRLRMQLGLKGV